MTMAVQCAICKHSTTQLRCDAYPKGVPDDILDGGFDHTKPFPGDNGIRFELIEDVASDEV